jgi:hypothetical protein
MIADLGVNSNQIQESQRRKELGDSTATLSHLIQVDFKM